MEYLRSGGSYSELGEAWTKYTAYLVSIKERIPRAAYEYAFASWHYDPRDHRAMHDSHLQQVLIDSPGPWNPEGCRIQVTLLGAYGDGLIRLTYDGVYEYELGDPRRPEPGPHTSEQPADWLTDEVRLGSSGRMIHEILFAGGRTWMI